MSTRQRDVIISATDVLRHEPIGKRIRAEVDAITVVDTTEAVLVWEPRRLLCEYAVPESALDATLRPHDTAADPAPPAEGLVFPGVPFVAHTADGEALDVQVGDRLLAGAAFRPADPDLAGLVVLDFDAFDSWRHEDELNIGHPRDPYHRLDTFAGSRRVRVEYDGTVIADSTRPTVLFEAMLPPRYYLPREDVRVELTPTDTSTVCTYKGRASYWSARVGTTDLTDVAWGYLEPLADSREIAGMVCFDDSQVQVHAESS
ncbi:Uncharacterized conserved protein, DUF427 family [Jatrophihabitans endophyticus]|uniref:Uncharacterized conserved protein, DUF427 family n=1 Tax=Jatrophihabitans endophyticus TaxID=1206085 RepID=A0A1M5PD98_9ACTN|nr:DUF427 domain-containing protein [Jatrophihabitans endophyticus]SHG99756.1 Uncharacterized conserved protein, DUF427 family [Jatrophihabitans endophyticus]